jgi:hypothetical protein
MFTCGLCRAASQETHCSRKSPGLLFLDKRKRIIGQHLAAKVPCVAEKYWSF